MAATELLLASNKKRSANCGSFDLLHQVLEGFRDLPVFPLGFFEVFPPGRGDRIVASGAAIGYFGRGDFDIALLFEPVQNGVEDGNHVLAVAAGFELRLDLIAVHRFFGQKSQHNKRACRSLEIRYERMTGIGQVFLSPPTHSILRNPPLWQLFLFRRTYDSILFVKNQYIALTTMQRYSITEARGG